ncbi:MAG TPA: hypothetical protein VHQ65_07825 [Thermoanaerobaculia bacterium]|nr:hypothetical protein [Thermoanaerobaculia bacterium]
MPPSRSAAAVPARALSRRATAARATAVEAVDPREVLRRRAAAVLATAAAVAALLLAGAAAAAAPPASPAPPVAAPPVAATIAVDEIERGMRGYGLTVFSGTEPQRFDAEVVGVVRHSAPGTSYILARLSGHGLEESGVAGGMSGSPVYFDGRLAGAVAFSWPFAQEAIAGITPIAAMRGITGAGGAALTGSSPPARVPAAAGAPVGGPVGAPPVPLADLLAGRVPADLVERELASWRPAAVSGATPGIHWSMVGFGQGSETLLRAGLGSAALSGEAVMDEAPRLVPGGPVAAVMIDGDLRLAANGTVTDIVGDQVFAFGHPFLGTGPIDLPMAAAEVVTIFSSRYNSFKISNLGPTVGAFRHDRQAAIVGQLGETAPMIPLTLTVNGPDGSRRFDMRIAEVPQVTPALVAVSAMGGLDAASYASGGQGLDMTARFEIAGHPSLEIAQSFDGDAAVGETVSYLLAFSAYLLQNEFEAVDVEGIEVELTQSQRPRLANLVGAHADRTVVRPGDPVTLELDFSAWRGETFRKSVTVEVPEDAPNGTYYLFVGDGPSVDAARLMIQKSEPVSFRQALALMESLHSRRDLLVLGAAAGAGLSVAGEVMPNLPGTVRSLWSTASSDSAVPLSLAVVQQHHEPLDVPVSGLTRIDLQVERREPLTRAAAAGGEGEVGGDGSDGTGAVEAAAADSPAAPAADRPAAAGGTGR